MAIISRETIALSFWIETMSSTCADGFSMRLRHIYFRDTELHWQKNLPLATLLVLDLCNGPCARSKIRASHMVVRSCT
jgi:hypothetical protein